jgi:hypothetical protein
MTCRTRSPEPSGAVIDVASIFNYSGGHWAAAAEANRFAFVYGGPGTGGLWLTMLDARGVKILESLLVAPAGGSSLVRPLAIASDGTRFGLLTEDWDGQADPLVRFRAAQIETCEARFRDRS